MHQLTYWQQLQQLKLYSLQRRRERYIIIYLWKMLEGVVPQVGNLKSYTHIRHGRKCRVPCVNTCATSRVRNIRNASFAINAPRLFNSLPKHIRDITDCSTDVFKNRLDNYLSTIADEPQIPGYTAIRRAETNSLLHMQHLRPQYWLLFKHINIVAVNLLLLAGAFCMGHFIPKDNPWPYDHMTYIFEMQYEKWKFCKLGRVVWNG